MGWPFFCLGGGSGGARRASARPMGSAAVRGNCAAQEGLATEAYNRRSAIWPVLNPYENGRLRIDSVLWPSRIQKMLSLKLLLQKYFRKNQMQQILNRSFGGLLPFLFAAQISWSAEIPLLSRGDTLPSFVLPQAVGLHLSASELQRQMKTQGQEFLLLSFWSTSCVPCHLEMPILIDWARTQPQVRLILINEDPATARDRALKFAESKLSGQQVLLDSYQILGDKTGVCKSKACTLPALIVTDQNFIVRCSLRGGAEASTLRKELDQCVKP